MGAAAAAPAAAAATPRPRNDRRFDFFSIFLSYFETSMTS
jgi:hypothetical protein